VTPTVIQRLREEIAEQERRALFMIEHGLDTANHRMGLIMIGQRADNLLRIVEQELIAKDAEIARLIDYANAWSEFAHHLQLCRDCAEGPMCETAHALNDAILVAAMPRAEVPE